jgi:hypothetical protein
MIRHPSFVIRYSKQCPFGATATQIHFILHFSHLEDPMKTIIALLLLLCAVAATTLPTTAPAPILTNVVVRDTDAHVPTTQAVANGGYVSSVPKHWSLQFNFATSQPTSMTFTIDGKQPHVEHYVPWVCEGDDVPINLAVGDHVVTWASGTQPPQAFAVSVLPAPVFGENLGGVGDVAGDLTLHPQLLATAKSLNLSLVRLWLEGSFTTQPSGSYFKIAKHWQNAGLKVIAVANFQNATPRCAAPSDSVWTNFWTGFPPPGQTGIFAISIGNEINTAAYYNGSVAQLAHLMSLAYPILHAKGYVVIAGSDLNDLSFYGQLNKLGAFNFCDRIDVHAYCGAPQQVVGLIDQGIAFGRSIHKPCDATEFGVRMSATNPTAWSAAEGQALAALKTRSGYLLPFSFYPMESLDQACPLNVNYEANEPYFSAFNAAIGSGGQK